MRVMAGLGPYWRKSSHSGTNGCVEARLHDGGIRVRDSYDPDGPELRFPARSWNAFLRQTERAHLA